MLGLTERSFNVNGTPANYIGTMVMVLDQDLRIVWAWDAFDYLDVNRGPILGEICHAGDPQVSCVVPEFPAFDWLHTNAVNWSPADGNLILSVRHQTLMRLLSGAYQGSSAIEAIATPDDYKHRRPREAHDVEAVEEILPEPLRLSSEGATTLTTASHARNARAG